MNWLKMLQNLCLAVPLLFVMSACGASAPAPAHDSGAVQDINPGDKSIIQPPAARNAGGSQLEERNI